MGRGRQKAKHTKVARELKYYSPNTDYSQLERELSANSGHAESSDASSGAQGEQDPWADYIDDHEDDQRS